MKKKKKSKVSVVEEKARSLTHDVLSLVNPRYVWDGISQKFNTFRSFHAENKFVMMSASMNLISAVIQISFGLILKSMSVISNAIDSLLDFVLGLFNLLLLNKSKRKRNGSYNYGYGKLQGFGALSQGGVMMFFSIMLAYFSVLKLMESTTMGGLDILIFIMILDFILGVGCVAYYHIVIKESTNLIVIGTLKKLYTGLVFNVGILLGLVLIRAGMRYFDAEWYFIDGLIGLIVAGYICFNAGELLYEGYLMLMDRSLSAEETKLIRKVIRSYEDDFHRRGNLRTRYSGTTKLIEFTLYFDAHENSFPEIYEVCQYLKEHIEEDIENSIVTIIPKPR